MLENKVNYCILCNFGGGVGGVERGGEIFLSEGPPTFLLFETTDSNIW